MSPLLRVSFFLAACVCSALVSGAPAPRPASAREDVIIVGAGMAGLGAAQVLLPKNVSFTLLEATNRTGGRIQASEFGHPSVGRYIVEFGANWIHGAGASNPIWQVAQSIDLHTQLVPNSTADLGNYAVYDEHYKLVPPGRLGELVSKFRAAFQCANNTAMHSREDESVAQAFYNCGWQAHDVVSETLEWEGTASDGAVPENKMSLFGTFPDGTYKW